MPRIVDKESKRREILEAAMRVFARSGVVKTRMEEIAREAHVGKGTIYEYFRSKEELFGAAFPHLFANIEERISRILEAESDPVQQLRKVMELTYTALVEEHPDLMEIMMDFWAEAVRQQDSQMLALFDLNAVYQKYRLLFIDIYQRGVKANQFRAFEPHLVACTLIAVGDGLFLQWILFRGVFDLRQAYRMATESLLSGLLLDR